MERTIRKVISTERIQEVICIGIILIVGIRGILPMWSMYILPDEFGYLSAGAWMSGYDWSEIASHSLYYSYGYGFLIAPVMKLFGTPGMVYKGVLLLNIIFWAVNFSLLYSISKKMLLDIDRRFLLAISFASTFFISNLIYAKIAWPEIFLMTLYLLIIRFIMLILVKPNARICGLLGALSVYMYTVHQRTIGIVIAVFATVIILTIQKKINAKQFAAFLGMFILIFFGHTQVKIAFREGLYAYSELQENTALAANDFAGQKEKLIFAFTTFSGLRTAIVGFIGKIYYLGVSSFGFFFWGVYGCVRKIWNDWKKKETTGSILAFFLLLSMLGCVGVNTLFMLAGERQDKLIYGRYSETILLPFLLLGFFVFWSEKKSVKKGMIIDGCLLIGSWVVNYKLQNLGSVQYNVVSALGTSFFFRDGRAVGNAVWYSTALAILIELVVYCFKKLPRMLGILCSAFLFVTVWCFGASDYIQGVYGAQNANHEFEKLSKIVTEYSEADEITYIDADADIVNRVFISHLQFNAPERKFYYVETSDPLSRCQTEFAVVLRSPRLTELMSNGYRRIYEYRGLILLVKGDTLAEQRLLEDEYNLGSDVEDGKIVYYGGDIPGTNNGIYQGSELISDGTEGYLMFGQYLPLDTGKYEIEVYMHLEKAETTELGSYDIVNGEEKLKEGFIDTLLFDKQKDGILKILLCVDEPLENMEIRIKVTEGTELGIKKMTIKACN